MRVDRVDRAVLRAIGGDVLQPAVVMAVVEEVLVALTSDGPASRLDDYRRELLTVSREIDRFTEAIAKGGPLVPLLEALEVRHGRRRELLAAIEAERERGAVRVDNGRSSGTFANGWPIGVGC